MLVQCKTGSYLVACMDRSFKWMTGSPLRHASTKSSRLIWEAQIRHTKRVRTEWLKWMSGYKKTIRAEQPNTNCVHHIEREDTLHRWGYQSAPMPWAKQKTRSCVRRCPSCIRSFELLLRCFGASRFQIASSLPHACAAHRLPQAGHGGGGWGPSTASVRPAEVAAPRRETSSRCIRIRPSPRLSPPAAPAPPSRSSSPSRSYPSPPPPPSSPSPLGKSKKLWCRRLLTLHLNPKPYVIITMPGLSCLGAVPGRSNSSCSPAEWVSLFSLLVSSPVFPAGLGVWGNHVRLQFAVLAHKVFVKIPSAKNACLVPLNSEWL
jgi:hypothetical protein